MKKADVISYYKNRIEASNDFIGMSNRSPLLRNRNFYTGRGIKLPNQEEMLMAEMGKKISCTPHRLLAPGAEKKFKLAAGMMKPITKFESKSDNSGFANALLTTGP